MVVALAFGPPSAPAAAREPVAVEVISDAARLADLAPEWTELAARSGNDVPAVSPGWVLAWWQVFGAPEGRTLAAAAFRRAGRLVGLAPMAGRRIWVRPGIPLRLLELIPSGEREADEICSEYLTVLAERGAEQEVAESLGAALGAGRLGEWDELRFPSMSAAGPMPALLTGAFERLGSIGLELTGGAPYISLPASWDEYLAALSPSRRRLVRTSMRSFETWSGGDARLHVADTPASLAEGSRILRDLHRRRWAAAGVRGAFRSPRFAAFHERVMADLLSRGALELMWLRARGEPVAAIYNIVWDGAVQFYQSGRRPDLPRGIRPGLVLHAMAIRRAIELGRREYDFLNGGSRYKQELALAVRPLVRLRVVRAHRLRFLRRLYDRGAAVWRASRRKP
jgi:CelD/BcsL family acetyltransferase involved in cellulose biosynthesis